MPTNRKIEEKKEGKERKKGIKNPEKKKKKSERKDGKERGKREKGINGKAPGKVSDRPEGG